MEDWQQWQIRAGEIAASLGEEVASLEALYLGQAADPTFRGFWPRFRDLKERVRTAPAIRLEDKLDLERRLRGLGAKAYRAQEVAYMHSGERMGQLLASIQGTRMVADQETEPRKLRVVRKDLDGLRQQFDTGVPLVPADRQGVWEAWKEANDFVWQRLNDQWARNEEILRAILSEAQSEAEKNNVAGIQQHISHFFESIRLNECRQNVLAELKSNADNLRAAAVRISAERVADKAASRQAQYVSPLDSWQTELDRNRENVGRLQDEIAELDQQLGKTGSILDQAMLRGTLVEKKRKLSELERSNRLLSQRIEQSQETPLIPSH